MIYTSTWGTKIYLEIPEAGRINFYSSADGVNYIAFGQLPHNSLAESTPLLLTPENVD